MDGGVLSQGEHLSYRIGGARLKRCIDERESADTFDAASILSNAHMRTDIVPWVRFGGGGRFNVRSHALKVINLKFP